MSRVMVDGLGACEGLVVAGWVERELADELPLEVDDADVLVGDEELDWPAFVGSSEADFVDLAVVAQADLAGLVDLVLAHPEVGGGLGDAVGFGLDAGAVGL
jgi:hypothetical protein